MTADVVVEERIRPRRWLRNQTADNGVVVAITQHERVEEVLAQAERGPFARLRDALEQAVDHRVAEAVGGGRELGQDLAVQARVVLRERTVSRLEVVLGHGSRSQHDWKELVVGDNLQLRGDYSSGFLEQLFIVPISVQSAQYPSDTIVLSHPQDVH